MLKEELLAKHGGTAKVLDYGHVRLVDIMGGDTAIVDMARKSYGKGTKATSDDQTLLRYLMRHWHTGPFEGCTIKLHVKCPIFVARQLFRHRTGSYDELSLRYSEAGDDFWLPEVLSCQSTDNKQGSGDYLLGQAGDEALCGMSQSLQASDAAYRALLAQGVAREEARAVLPLATYTEYYFVMNLHNLLHLLQLRLHPHAQKETRAYATLIASIVADWCPWTWQAFQDYRLNAVSFTGPEILLLKGLFSGASTPTGQYPGLGKRETKEFLDKLGKLGID